MSKKRRRMSAAVTAFCMMAAMAIPFDTSITAEAVTWRCGDVDNDGKVTITDTVQLTKYLNGMVEIVDYTKADLNADCIVDIVDSKIMDMYFGEKISSLPYTRYGGGSQYATVGAQSVNELKNYTVFDAKTGEALDGYSLDPNPITDKSRVVIGEDTRYRDDSLPGVVKIINSDTLTGSGFVVDAHTIATAAHCVFDYQHGDFQNSEHPVKKIVLTDNDGNVSKEITGVCEVHVPNKFIVTSTEMDRNQDDEYKNAYYREKLTPYDYALITVSENLSEYACFDLGIATDGIMSDSREIYCTGYPGAIFKEGGSSSGTMVNDWSNRHNKYTGKGFFMDESPLSQPARNIRYNIDTSGGNSGGPVYVKTDVGNTTYYTVIGINTYNLKDGISNGGTQMTTELLHFYKNNPYLMW